MKLYVLEPEIEDEILEYETGTTDGLRRPIVGKTEAEDDVHAALIAWVMEER
jgi:hypothetical protein